MSGSAQTRELAAKYAQTAEKSELEQQMKVTLRQATWTLALAFALTAFGTPTLAAAYQSQEGLEHGRGHNKNRGNNNDNPSYKQGWNHGQEDRAGNRARQYRVHPDNDADRRAYEAGYDEGYQNNDRQRGNGAYGQYGSRQYGSNNNQNVAYNNGFQQGLKYGQSDRSSGHSNRPTYSSTYQNGSNGYGNSGDRMNYKRTFQEGFRAGYDQGYNGRGGYRR